MGLLRGRFWLWPLGGIALILGFNVFMSLPRFSTSNPAFCLTCHGTRETPDKSVQSRVHPSYNVVTCTDCHAKPGFVGVIDGYREGFSADPERVNPNCLRCHSNIVDKALKDFKYNVMNIRIPHKFHIETVGAKCTDCHANVAHDLSDERTNRPHRDYCFRCHTGAASQPADSKFCTKCHS